MQWHPTLSTLLMVACQDDMSPVIQLWDLRSAAAMTPAKELLGHNKVAHCIVMSVLVHLKPETCRFCLPDLRQAPGKQTAVEDESRSSSMLQRLAVSGQAFHTQPVFIVCWVRKCPSKCQVVHLLTAMPCAWHHEVINALGLHPQSGQGSVCMSVSCV